jgi:beta-glucosidase
MSARTRVLFALAVASTAASAPPRRHPHRLDARVAAVVANMTLAQKAATLDMWFGSVDLLTNGTLDGAKVAAAFATGAAPVVHDLYDPTGDIQRALQAYVRSAPNSAGVPILFVEECLHGTQQAGKTVLPQQIALAASFNPPLAGAVGALIGKESRAYGIHQCFAPVIGTAREPRWGRVEETYGEDVWLTGELAYHWVLGAQGGAPDGSALHRNTSIVAEPKHFVAHAGPEGGNNAAPVHIGRRELLTTYAPQFERAVRDAGARGIMAAYHEIDGLPSCANEYALTGLLRDEWGFQGWVLADDGAVHMMVDTHATAAGPADALAQFLTAGGNTPYYDWPHNVTQGAIVASVLNGSLAGDVLDARVADHVRVRMELGLFDDPNPTPGLIATNVDTPQARELALTVARQAVTLLKNDAVAAVGVGGAGSAAPRPVLPLDVGPGGAVRRIAVIGPSADVMRLGDYSGGGVHESWVTPLAGIAAAAEAAGVAVTFSLGVQTNSPGDVLAGGPFGLEWVPVPPGRFRAAAAGPGAAVVGVNGSYWAGAAMAGPPGFTRLDADINFGLYVYGPGAYVRSPVTGGTPFLDAQFCARWEGAVVPPTTAAGVSVTVFADGPGTTFSLSLGGAVVQTTGDPPAVLSVTAGVPLPLQLDVCRDPAGQSIVLAWALLPGGNATGTEDAGIADALAAATAADVAVLVLGESDGGLVKANVGEGVDVNDLRLPGRQGELAAAVAAAGVPTVVVLAHGRPLAVPELAGAPGSGSGGGGVPAALLSTWFNGQAQGTALADVLFGVYNPAGRTPMTWPRDAGALPCFYNHKPSARGAYLYEPNTPVFPFGHGLSYTAFAYSRLTVDPPVVSLASGASVAVSVTVTNVGAVGGEEVAQLYVRDDVASVTTPVRSLKGVVRTAPIPPGQAVVVTFTLSPAAHLWLVNRTYARVVEPGAFTLWVGASSADLRLNATLSVVP